MARLPFIPPFCAFTSVMARSSPRQPLRPAEAAAAASDDDFAYRAMEHGAYYLPQPRNQIPTSRVSCKIFFRYFTIVFGVGMVAALFVGRYRYHHPELQDPLNMIALTMMALIVAGAGYITTLEDV